jgi:hypothetical protein
MFVIVPFAQGILAPFVEQTRTKMEIQEMEHLGENGQIATQQSMFLIALQCVSPHPTSARRASGHKADHGEQQWRGQYRQRLACPAQGKLAQASPRRIVRGLKLGRARCLRRSWCLDSAI